MEYESFADQATMREVAVVVAQRNKDDREHYELIKHAVAVGYASAKKGKDIKMFEEPEKAITGTISQEEKESTFAELQAKLGGA